MANTEPAGNAVPSRADLASPVRSALDAATLAMSGVDEPAARSAYANLEQSVDALLGQLAAGRILDEDGKPVDLGDE